MNYISNFNSNHYQHFLLKTNKILNNYDDLNCWLISLNISEIIMWLKLTKLLLDNLSDFELESSVLLTLLITLFIKELSVPEESVELNDTEIKKIVKRFYISLMMEYFFKKYPEKRNVEHSIIKNISYHH